MYQLAETAEAYERLAEMCDVTPEQAERFRSRAAKLRAMAEVSDFASGKAGCQYDRPIQGG